MSEGTIIEQTSYNAKGKEESKSISKIIKRAEKGNTIEATLQAQVYDNKDKLISDGEYVIICENGIFSMDLSGIVPSDAWNNYENMTVKIDGGFMDFPTNPTPGDKLDDSKMSVNIENAGMAIMSITVDIINRKVETKEQVTTPAGTFDCVVFTYDMVTTMGGILPMKVTTSSKDWFAKNAGMIKQESYDKKGNLSGYTLLTNLKR